MGVDRHTARILCLMQQRGVSFDRVLTVGRLGLHLHVNELRQILAPCPSDLVPRLFAEEAGFAEPFLRHLGAREIVSLDASEFEGATWRHDLNLPIPKEWHERFSLVVDGGTLEHVFDYPRALKNAMDMVEVGGHFLTVTPANHFFGHGFYQFSPELFFRVFREANGFTLHAVLAFEMDGKAWYRVKDPAEAGGRIHLHNRRPTSLAVWASKIRQVNELDLQHQSDYVTHWSKPTDRPGCRHTARYNRPWYKNWADTFKKAFKPAFPAKYFERVREDGVGKEDFTRSKVAQV